MASCVCGYKFFHQVDRHASECPISILKEACEKAVSFLTWDEPNGRGSVGDVIATLYRAINCTTIMPKAPTVIVLNGEKMTLEAGFDTLTYDDVLKLSGEKAGASVVYKGAAGPKPEGCLISGQQILVKNGTVINAIQTGNA